MRAEKQHRQTLFNNQQLMLRQSLLHNTELKNRLAQIQVLTAGIDTPIMPSASIKTSRSRTPINTQSFTSSGSSVPRYGSKDLARFDSFVSVRSTLSETFFDALDDVSNNNNNTQKATIASPPSAMHPQLWAELHIHVHVSIQECTMT